MGQSRRNFLKTSGLLAASSVGLKPKKSEAAAKKIVSDDRMGVLVDTTICIGCRRCEFACKKAHDIPAGTIEEYDNQNVFENSRRPDHTALTVVNRYPDENEPINVKVQCMHCDHPSCLSACIVGAFSKEENGSVVWDASKCIGCRYCMIACPFQIPAFEYEKAIEPRIMKCDFCNSRTSKGGIPACVETCPMEALTYGKRFELLKLAEDRIRKNPDRYVDHIYGKDEVAGTSWLYLAPKDFKELDFPEHSSDAAPGTTEAIQHGIFAYFVPPASLFALLGGIMWLNRKKTDQEQE